ncbi:MAG TPA: DUF5050 domain-containing protein [Opitutus sp.]|nr:DUF5050 domain-containing protein [Opitutus sp.]
MIAPSRFGFSFIAGISLAVALGSARSSAADSSAPLGAFSERADIGSVSRPTTAFHDASKNTYTIAASGANMWGTEDAFGFVWKKVSGDIAIAAEITILGSSNQPHRKACLIFRQSLEPDAAYADVAVHGNGLTSLQFRGEAGGSTYTIQSPVNAPQRVRLEKRGAFVTLSIAGADGVYSPSGCVTRLALDGTFYVGLAVCAHDNTAVETATFSNVELGAPPPLSTRTTALEVIALASLDRRVVYRAEGKMESPHFSPDGAALFFNRDGRIERVTLEATASPVVIDTGFAIRNINDHGISPDGTQLVISDLTETGKSLMYLVPIGGGPPTRVDVPEPALWHGWSPDGRTLTYCAQRDGNYDVYTVPVAGGKETRLTTASGNDNGPDFSADGNWIYYHSNSTGQFQIWRMHADGSNKEPVTEDDYSNWFPHPSPDGKWIAIISTKVVPDTGHPPDGDYVLRLIPANGGKIRDVAHFYGANGSFNVPCWSRDSLHLAYASYSPVR